MAWVYVVLNLDGHFYIGMTTDLEARIRDHNFGRSKMDEVSRTLESCQVSSMPNNR
jgi:predicted GIY-YIG superfamily endonuclease